MLTIQQLQPTVTNLSELIRRGEFVGYQAGSSVEGLLKQQGFHESKLKPYCSPVELDEQLTNGSAKGGIAAVFDESPYMKLFLAKYCSKYTMVRTIQKTGGFGFVFPTGSPLVSDVSTAILKLTEGDILVAIEKRWIAQEDVCLNTSGHANTTSLGLDSFWGLFLIVGIASLLALSMFAVFFLYEQRKILTHSGISIWTKIWTLAGNFDQRDAEFHTFRKTKQHQSSNGDTRSVHLDGVDASETTPNTDCPPRPSIYSLSPEVNVASSGEGGSQSPDHVHSAADMQGD
ncbi:hypothetical protein Ancab_040179 [Ancistrocladus abbreviatus]